jgi:aminoglycoside phosphotransferase (APT) family kinase protein
MARQAMIALAGIHRVDWHRAPYLGEPIPFDEDVTRWDRFMPKVAEPERLRAVPEVRQLLLDRLPVGTNIGIFHGDFQWANLFYSFDGDLLAVIDWELVGVGATGNDVGWIATFNDPAAWSSERKPSNLMPQADELVAMYVEAWGAPVEHLDWFRALAAYKFAIISGFNLALHRRGKREDPVWETTALSIEPLLERVRELLSRQSVR